MVVAEGSDQFFTMKTQEGFWLETVASIRFFFGHCHVTFPYVEPLSFFGRSVPKVAVLCFSDSIVWKAPGKLDDSCNIQNDSQLLCKTLKKHLL